MFRYLLSLLILAPALGLAQPGPRPIRLIGGSAFGTNVNGFSWTIPTNSGSSGGPFVAQNAGTGTNLTLYGALYGSNAVQLLLMPKQAAFTNSLYIGNGGSNTSRTGTAPVDPLSFESDGTFNGLFNTFVGINAGLANTTGNLNLFAGNDAGTANLNGDQNTFLGSLAGNANTSGYHNTFVGAGAGQANVIGNYNVFVGTDAGLNVTACENNVYAGQSAGISTAGSNNVAIGNAPLNSANGNGNVAIGYASGDSAPGSFNTGLGYLSLYGMAGSYNSVFGAHDNASHNTSGSRNVYIGKNAGPASDVSESDKLYIANAGGTPLIGGDFSAGTVVVNGGLSATGAVHRFQSASSADTLVVTGGRVGIGNPSPAAVGFMDVGDSTVYGELIRFHYGSRLGGVGINANGGDYATGIYYAGAVVGSFDSNGGLALGTFANSTTPPANGLAVSGAVKAGTAGTLITNIRHGISGAMVLGTVTVTDTGCTANTRYFFTAHTLGTISVPGSYYASTRTASTSFVITSSQPTETSTIDWMAVEP